MDNSGKKEFVGSGERVKEAEKTKGDPNNESVQDGNPVPRVLKNGIPFILLNNIKTLLVRKKKIDTRKGKCIISFFLDTLIHGNWAMKGKHVFWKQCTPRRESMLNPGFFYFRNQMLTLLNIKYWICYWINMKAGGTPGGGLPPSTHISWFTLNSIWSFSHKLFTSIVNTRLSNSKFSILTFWFKKTIGVSQKQIFNSNLQNQESHHNDYLWVVKGNAESITHICLHKTDQVR